MFDIFNISRQNENKLLWYVVIILCSALPLIIRLIISTAVVIPKYDLKDVLFAGLAINLSNFSLINSDKLPAKSLIACLSGILIAIIGTIIGAIILLESVKEPPNLVVINISSVLLATGSACVSYQANKFLF